MSALSLQHTPLFFVAMIVQQWSHSHLYKDEVSSLVQILQLLASYHEVSESLSSELSLKVSEELPESVPLGLKLYAIGINELSLAYEP